MFKHLVIHSLMPKGVEHSEHVPCPIVWPQVIHSLMPKGVEHIEVAPVGPVPPGDSFVDAERR